MILTEEIENSLKNEAEIDDLLKQIHDMDFSEYIHHLFEKYHLKEADIIRKSGLERTYAYKIIRGEKGKNAKDKIYRLALAMNLTQKETNHLLSLNNAGDLYPHNARDLILLNGLLKKQTVEEVNIELYNHDLEPLKRLIRTSKEVLFFIIKRLIKLINNCLSIVFIDCYFNKILSLNNTYILFC